MGSHSSTCNHQLIYSLSEKYRLNMAKFLALLLLAFVIGCTVAAPQFGRQPGGFGGNQFGGFGGRPGGSSLGFGNGATNQGAAIGTGTGIANAPPGGFGVGLGVGGAIQTPFGSQTFGQGNAVSVGK